MNEGTNKGRKEGTNTTSVHHRRDRRDVLYTIAIIVLCEKENAKKEVIQFLVNKINENFFLKKRPT